MRIRLTRGAFRRACARARAFGRSAAVLGPEPVGRRRRCRGSRPTVEPGRRRRRRRRRPTQTAPFTVPNRPRPALGRDLDGDEIGFGVVVLLVIGVSLASSCAMPRPRAGPAKARDRQREGHWPSRSSTGSSAPPKESAPGAHGVRAAERERPQQLPQLALMGPLKRAGRIRAMSTDGVVIVGGGVGGAALAEALRRGGYEAPVPDRRGSATVPTIGPRSRRTCCSRTNVAVPAFPRGVVRGQGGRADPRRPARALDPRAAVAIDALAGRASSRYSEPRSRPRAKSGSARAPDAEDQLDRPCPRTRSGRKAGTATSSSTAGPSRAGADRRDGGARRRRSAPGVIPAAPQRLGTALRRPTRPPRSTTHRCSSARILPRSLKRAHQ